MKDPNRNACLIADGDRYSPSQINAFVLGQGSMQQAAVTVLVHCRDAQRQATKDVGKDLRFGGSAHHERTDSCCAHFRHGEQRRWQDGGEPR